MKWAHENDFNAEINAVAQKYMIDPAIIKAVVAHESQGFNARAYRFEPWISPTTGKYRPQFAPRPDFPKGGGASYGLTQILDTTARGMGFTGPLTGLFDPATNLDLGIQFLRDAIVQASNTGKPLDNALSAYNGGWGSSYGGAPAYGPFANQDYVNVIKSYISYFQSAGSDAETVYSTGDISGGSNSSAAEINLSTGLPYSADDLPTTTETASIAGLLIAGAVGLFFLMKAKSH